MTIDDLIKNAEGALRAAEGRARAATSEKFRLIGSGTAEAAAQATERCADAEDAVTAARDALAELRATKRADELVDKLAQQVIPTGVTVPGSPGAAGVGRTYTTSPRTYRAPGHRGDGDPDFLTDLMRTQLLADPDAGARLARHGQEVAVDNPRLHARAVSTGGVAGFVPPAYLSELFAEYLRAGRPTANLCTTMPLPETGLVVNVPRITTASTTAVQAAQHDAISNTDLDDTVLAVDVRTIAGRTRISRQALERGVLVEDVAFADLAADYAAKLDTSLIKDDGTSGTHLGVLATSGINAVTYTDASPTLAELWPKLADAVGRVMSSRFTGPTAIVMRPNVWAWILSTLGSDSRPVVAATNAGPTNAVGVSVGTDYGQAVGTLLGVPVVLDGNVPANLGGGTNETRIVVGDFRDALLFEDAGGPVQLRFDQAAGSTLGVDLIVYGYSAFTAGRHPEAFSVIAGTGMIIPAL